MVETSAGLGSGLTDEEYRAAGATIVDKAGDIFARAEMVVKVKEPQAAERKMLRRGQIAVHLSASRARPAADRDLIKAARPASPMRR